MLKYLFIYYKRINTTEFPKNSSEDISDIHFHFDYIYPSIINIAYFNEKYISYYILNPNTENITYKHISLEVKEKNNLILFLHPENSTYNSSINIVQFDYKSEEKLKIIKTYSFKSQKNIINCNCVSASSNNNNIICGFIEEEKLVNTSSGTSKISYSFEYSLIFFSESKPSPNKISLNNHIISTVPKTENGILVNNFIKLIPLSEEKTIFCFDEKKAYLINKIEIKSTIYLSYKNISRNSDEKYLTMNAFDGLKINDQQAILIYYHCEKFKISLQNLLYKYIYYNKITIKNDI